jgi:NADPH-dependent ferric siderophore reductase
MSTTTVKRASRPLRRRPAPAMGFFRTQVTGVRQLTPSMIRVSLGGPDLAGFVNDGPDQRIKIFLPLPGQPDPMLPTELGEHDNWFAAYRAIAADIRPIMRTYTLRRHRPETGEVDVDFAIHGDLGPASRWATTAKRGDSLTIFGPYADYDPTPGTDWQLLIGDETALPAIGAIVESLPAGVQVHAFVEVDDEAEQQSYLTMGDVTFTWVHRHATANAQPTATSGSDVNAAQAGGSVQVRSVRGRLLEAVRAAELPTGKPYVWLGGEAGAVKELRRHLVNERGIAREDLYFVGYWRRGRSEDDAYAAAERGEVDELDD